MVLSDFSSRQKTDDSNPHEIIPISFTLKSLACEHFYQFNSMTGISETETNKYLIQTRSRAKSSDIKVLEIHGVKKGINPHVMPERQRPLPILPTHNITPTNPTQPINKGLPTHPIPRPRIGQGIPLPLPQHQPVDPTCIIQPIAPKSNIGHLLPTMIHTQDLHQDLWT